MGHSTAFVHMILNGGSTRLFRSNILVEHGRISDKKPDRPVCDVIAILFGSIVLILI